MPPARRASSAWLRPRWRRLLDSKSYFTNMVAGRDETDNHNDPQTGAENFIRSRYHATPPHGATAGLRKDGGTLRNHQHFASESGWASSLNNNPAQSIPFCGCAPTASLIHENLIFHSGGIVASLRIHRTSGGSSGKNGPFFEERFDGIKNQGARWRGIRMRGLWS